MPADWFRRTADDPGLFTPDSAVWRVHGNRSGLVGGLRALLLQAVHPLAMAGVAQHSDYRRDPWGRLHRTGSFIAVTTYGSTSAAEANIEMVKRIHLRVHGVASDGRPYTASDPHLLAWVHDTEVDSFLARLPALRGRGPGRSGHGPVRGGDGRDRPATRCDRSARTGLRYELSSSGTGPSSRCPPTPVRRCGSCSGRRCRRTCGLPTGSSSPRRSGCCPGSSDAICTCRWHRCRTRCWCVLRPGRCSARAGHGPRRRRSGQAHGGGGGARGDHGGGPCPGAHRTTGWSGAQRGAAAHRCRVDQASGSPVSVSRAGGEGGATPKGSPNPKAGAGAKGSTNPKAAASPKAAATRKEPATRGPSGTRRSTASTTSRARRR